jgi:hypothetical protein
LPPKTPEDLRAERTVALDKYVNALYHRYLNQNDLQTRCVVA